jgi:uncharacterized membrane protein YdbT with pleckstrin-like domain
MGFPENVLAKSERVERSIHPHWITVVGPLLLGLVLIAGGIGLAAATPNDSTGNGIQWVSVGVLVLIAIPLVLVPFLRWRTTHYVVTSHRVMVRRGILSKSGKDITLSKITDVSFEQSLLDRIINSGSLRIESAGDSPDELLRNIPHSNHVQQLINRLIDEDDTRRRMVANGGAGQGRPGHAPGEDDDDEGRMPLSSDPDRRDRPRLAEE